MSRLVLISGPPQCGKSTAGRAISDFFGADHFAVSDRLKIETHLCYGLSEDLAVDHFERNKDVPCPEFGGLTPRQAYIHVSEDIIKPTYGDDFLGQCAVERLLDPRFGIKVISGAGFMEEVLPLIAAVGATNTLHIRVTPGDGLSRKEIADSRTALHLGESGVSEVDLTNRFDTQFHALAIAAVASAFQMEAVAAAEAEMEFALG